MPSRSSQMTASAGRTQADVHDRLGVVVGHGAVGCRDRIGASATASASRAYSFFERPESISSDATTTSVFQCRFTPLSSSTETLLRRSGLLALRMATALCAHRCEGRANRGEEDGGGGVTPKTRPESASMTMRYPPVVTLEGDRGAGSRRRRRSPPPRQRTKSRAPSLRNRSERDKAVFCSRFRHCQVLATAMEAKIRESRGDAPACTCESGVARVGDDAERYADFHLAFTGADPESNSRRYICPLTNRLWRLSYRGVKSPVAELSPMTG